MPDKNWPDYDDQQLKEWLDGSPGDSPAPTVNEKTIVSMSWPEFQKILAANESLAEEEAYLRFSRNCWRATALVFMAGYAMLYFLCGR